MANITDNATRTAHLLALMRKGNNAFNARDFAAVNAVHRPTWWRTSPGTHSRSTEAPIHAEAMRQMLRIFPDMHVSTPYPIQWGVAIRSPSSPAPPVSSPGRWSVPNGKAVAPTGKAFDVEFGQTTRWDRRIGSSSSFALFGTRLCRRSKSASPGGAERVPSPPSARSPGNRARAYSPAAWRLRRVGRMETRVSVGPKPDICTSHGLGVCSREVVDSAGLRVHAPGRRLFSAPSSKSVAVPETPGSRHDASPSDRLDASVPGSSCGWHRQHDSVKAGFRRIAEQHFRAHTRETGTANLVRAGLVRATSVGVNRICGSVEIRTLTQAALGRSPRTSLTTGASKNRVSASLVACGLSSMIQCPVLGKITALAFAATSFTCCRERFPLLSLRRSTEPASSVWSARLAKSFAAC